MVKDSRSPYHSLQPLWLSQENLQRQKIKEMLSNWDRDFPGRVDNIAKSLCNITPSHLGDADLFDFASLSPPGRLARLEVTEIV